MLVVVDGTTETTGVATLDDGVVDAEVDSEAVDSFDGDGSTLGSGITESLPTDDCDGVGDSGDAAILSDHDVVKEPEASQ